MKLNRHFAVIASAVVLALSAACSWGRDPAWETSFNAAEQQFELISQAHAQQGASASPEAQAAYRHMQDLWARMSQARSGMMRGRGMMMGRGMTGSPEMMRFSEQNQQMLSFCLGLQQMMRQSGHMETASMYGQMARHMRSVLSNLPERSAETPSPQQDGSNVDGASIFAGNCAACHGPDGAGVSGVFPPLDGSSIVTGDKTVLAKIVLHGLQGPVTVRGTRYDGFMPAFESTLTDAQIAAALTYTRSLALNGASAVSAEDVHNARGLAPPNNQAWSAEELGLD